MILGLDTSAAQCAVALVHGDQEWIYREPMERGHAERLFPMIGEVLIEAKATHSDIIRVGVCTGPGSFTGIRVGVAAARGLALGLGVPAIGVTRFEALWAGQELRQSALIAIPGRQGKSYRQTLAANGTEMEKPFEYDGASIGIGADLIGSDSDDLQALADPAVIARVAAKRKPDERPAPLYIRGADAAPSREGPPPLLNG